MSVVAIIVSHDPELSRFRLVLSQASKQVNHVIIIDNDSRGKGVLRDLCGGFGNCDFIEVGFNSGVAHALRVGVNYASKYKPDWLLFLDDDTILMNNAIKTALNLTALRPIKSRIGSINLGSENGPCSVKDTRYVMFSGLLIRFDIASKVCCRDDFFPDQADYDLGLKIRNLGYLTIKIDCKLIDHKLGVKRWVPIISNILHRPIDYEPPWRYYYIIRNSTRLLIEGRMDFALYMRQLINWGVRILLADGPRSSLSRWGWA